jgi:hypothetical protein
MKLNDKKVAMSINEQHFIYWIDGYRTLYTFVKFSDKLKVAKKILP